MSLKECKTLKYHAKIMKKSYKKNTSIKNNPIYLFGAPAKGNTLINYFGINYRKINACLETSKKKLESLCLNHVYLL